MRKQVQRRIEYLSLIAFAAGIRRLPLSWARFIARRLADIAWSVIRIRRDVVIQNLTAAFAGEKTAAEILAIGRANYRQFATTMVELLFFPNFSREQVASMVTFVNLDVVDQVFKEGKGAVLVGAHFGNWELMGAALAQKYPLSFVVGQQENIPVDNLLNSYRTAKGIKLIPLKLALRGVMKTLKANEFIAILADQDAHEHGAFVPFFGRPASTPKGPAMFALRAQCPMIMGNIYRTDTGFTVAFDLVPKPVPSGDESKDIEQYTANHAAILESYVRRFPDHWFWMHRRWKTKPQ